MSAPVVLRAILRSALVIAVTVAPVAAGASGATTAYLYRAPLQWTDDTGRNVALADWKGGPVIITMAYSSCRRTCSSTLIRLQEIQRVLDAKGRSAQFVVVTYDPETDDPQTWAQYRRTRNLTRPNWHFLTGSRADTRRIARLLGLDFWMYDNHVMHDFKIIVLDGNGAVDKEIGFAPVDFERLF
jgi:protein SCO1/2